MFPLTMWFPRSPMATR